MGAKRTRSLELKEVPGPQKYVKSLGPYFYLLLGVQVSVEGSGLRV